MVAVERQRHGCRAPNRRSPAGAARIADSVALAVLFATASSSNTASTAKATSGSSATPTMPTSRRLRNRRLGSRLRGCLPRPILMACLQIPPVAANIPISPSTTPVPLYGRGTMHARVCRGPPTHVPRGARRWRPAMPLVTVLARRARRLHVLTPREIAHQRSRRHGNRGRDPDRRGLAGADDAARRRDHRGASPFAGVIAAPGRGRAALVPLDSTRPRPRPLRRTTGAPTSRPRSRPWPTAGSRRAAAPTRRRRCA